MPFISHKSKAVSAYIRKYPPNVRKILEKIRITIRKAAPEAEETISYRIPAYKMGRDLVYFAAFRDHISFFPTSSGVSAFKKELASHAVSKGTVHFKLDEPVPYGLIGRIVKLRVRETMAAKKKKY